MVTNPIEGPNPIAPQARQLESWPDKLAAGQVVRSSGLGYRYWLELWQYIVTNPIEGPNPIAPLGRRIKSWPNTLAVSGRGLGDCQPILVYMLYCTLLRGGGSSFKILI